MNLAQHLVRAARELPALDALRWPGGTLDFAGLEAQSSAIAHVFVKSVDCVCRIPPRCPIVAPTLAVTRREVPVPV